MTEDLIEYPAFNLLFWALGIIITIIGSKHLGMHGTNWSGGSVAVFGVLILYIQFAWMESKMTKEK